jgi:hypothetical protein
VIQTPESLRAPLSLFGLLCCSQLRIKGVRTPPRVSNIFFLKKDKVLVLQKAIGKK